MGFDEDYSKFNFYIEDKVEELRNTEEWSDSKIAFYLRDLAQQLNPKGRKSKKITIDPLKVSDEELKKYPTEIQERIKNIKLKLTKLNDGNDGIPPKLKSSGILPTNYMRCENCGIDKLFNEKYNFYFCKMTKGMKCRCGHRHYKHDSELGCLKCNCKLFLLRGAKEK